MFFLINGSLKKIIRKLANKIERGLEGDDLCDLAKVQCNGVSMPFVAISLSFFWRLL